MTFISKFPLMRHAGVVAALTILAACSSSETALERKGPPQLHLACQTVECECLGERKSLFSDPETTEIVWRLNGDATCPPGFTLQRIETDFLGRRK